MVYKGFTVSDEKVDSYVEKLDCSIIEACELILEEQGKINQSEEVKKDIEQIEEKTKGKRRYEQSSDKPRKKVVKERKVDNDKLNLINMILESMGTAITEVKVDNEKAIDFNYNGKAYTVRLIAHRQPKQ